KEEAVMERHELLEIIEKGLQTMRHQIAMDARSAKPPVFDVRQIGNGFIITYDDIELFERRVPIYPPPPGAPGTIGSPAAEPKIEMQRRYRFKRQEVFCANAMAIKAAVDEALRLEEK